MTIFAFDVTLTAVVRVEARTEEEARRFMHETLDCLDVARTVHTPECMLTITEASLDGSPTLFEVETVNAA